MHLYNDQCNRLWLKLRPSDASIMQTASMTARCWENTYPYMARMDDLTWGKAKSKFGLEVTFTAV